MKKGISILSLAIVIVVMALISSVIIISYEGSANNLNKVRFVTEFMTLESALENYYSMQGNYPVLEEIILNITDTDDDTQFEGEINSDNKINLYKLDVATLGFDKLNFGMGKSDQDYYAVSLLTGKMYYIPGFEHNNIVYYRVTEELTENYN